MGAELSKAVRSWLVLYFFLLAFSVRNFYTGFSLNKYIKLTYILKHSLIVIEDHLMSRPQRPMSLPKLIQNHICGKGLERGQFAYYISTLPIVQGLSLGLLCRRC